MKNFKQYLEESVILESKLDDFISFASDNLELQDTPKVVLLQARDKDMTTANYCPNSKTMKIYAKNRALFDIARSIAHELVHAEQYHTGKLKKKYVQKKGWLHHWNGTPGKKGTTYKAYRDQPWEQEAWNRQMYLAEKVCSILEAKYP